MTTQTYNPAHVSRAIGSWKEEAYSVAELDALAAQKQYYLDQVRAIVTKHPPESQDPDQSLSFHSRSEGAQTADYVDRVLRHGGWPPSQAQVHGAEDWSAAAPAESELGRALVDALRSSFSVSASTVTLASRHWSRSSGELAARQPRTSESKSLVRGIDAVIPSLERINAISNLPLNWDGEDAERTTGSAVGAACLLVARIAAILQRTSNASEPRFVPLTSSPLSDGGIQIEWQGTNARIDVQVNPDGTVGYLIKRGSGAQVSYEEADESSISEVIQLIQDVVGS